MSFLDENCLLFDNEDENKLEYTSIHAVRFASVNENVGFQKACGRFAK